VVLNIAGSYKGDEYKKLRGISIEAIACIIGYIGKDHYGAYIGQFLQLLIDI
jgi:hypothetical protein